MTHKIGGCCSKCDTPCFEVVQVFDSTEERAGEPKKLGAPLPDSVRVTFLLYDGTQCDLTFCGSCAQELCPAWYVGLWKKCINSWVRELDRKPEAARRPGWLYKQFYNGLLAEVRRVSWKDMIDA